MISLLIVALTPAWAVANGVDVQELVESSIKATERNWEAAPRFSFVITHDRKSDNSVQSKSHRVVTIEGSPYQMLVAEDGHPLTPARQDQEKQRLRKEIRRRNQESAAERNRRIGEYREDRDRDHMLLMELAHALRYKLAGEQQVDKRPTWVLEGTPRPEYVPENRAARVLTGTNVKLWIDKESLQWVRVVGEVIKAVPFYGSLAKVEAGTRFELRQAPVARGYWMPTQFSVRVKAAILGVVKRDYVEETRYDDYEPTHEFLSELEPFEQIRPNASNP